MPRQYKDILLPYERILETEGLEKRTYALSETTRQIILALSHSFYWRTRWFDEELDGIIDAGKIANVRKWASLLEQELLAEQPPAIQCVDYFPYSPLIDWQPQDPFTEPEYVPSGYGSPPFQVVTSEDTALLLLGLQVGDVITDITKFLNPTFPNWFPTEGFARFRIVVQAPAEIELHLLQIPLGGIVTIVENENIIPIATMDLDKDLVSLPIETVTEIVWEYIITDDTEHTFDVTFLPQINDEIPFVKVGGGLRKITICREFECVEGEGTPLDVRQNPELPCRLEKSADEGETWIEFADLRLCSPATRPRVGGGYEVYNPVTEEWENPPLPPVAARGEANTEDRLCLASANAAEVIQMAYEEIRDRYSNGASVFVIAALAIALLGFIFVFPPVLILVIEAVGLMIAYGGFAAAVLNEDDKNEIICILLENATDNAGVVTFDFSSVVSQMQSHNYLPVKIAGVMLPILGEDGLNRAGTTTSVTTFDCDVCSDLCPIWLFPEPMPSWEFFNQAFGWQQDTNGAYIYTNYGNNEHFSGGMDMPVTVPAGCTITGAKFTITNGIPGGGYNHIEFWVGTNRTNGLTGTNGVDFKYSTPIAAGVHTITKNIVGTGQGVHINLSWVHNKLQNPPPRVTRIELMYTGTKPIFSGGMLCGGEG